MPDSTSHASSPSRGGHRWRLILSLTATVIALAAVYVAFLRIGAPPANRFSLTVTYDGISKRIEGASEFTATPSSYSIQMDGPGGRCVLHMLNFSTAPGEGTYDVEDRASVRTAMVCLLEGVEPKERLGSVSGSFTIKRMDRLGLKGRFDMEFTGPLSGRRYRVAGEVESVNSPLNLAF